MFSTFVPALFAMNQLAIMKNVLSILDIVVKHVLVSPTRKDEIFTNKMYCRKRPQKRCFTMYNMHAVKILFSEKNIALCCALGHKPFPKNWYILKTRYIHVQYNVWINPLGLFLWHCDKIASVYFIPDLQKKPLRWGKYIYICTRWT